MSMCGGRNVTWTELKAIDDLAARMSTENHRVTREEAADAYFQEQEAPKKTRAASKPAAIVEMKEAG